MGGRHRRRFELCGVEFVAVADTQAEFDGIVDKLNIEKESDVNSAFFLN